MNTDIKDLSDIASIFNVTPKTVRDWCKKGLPVVALGTQGGQRHRTRISLAAATAWFFKFNEEQLNLMRAQTRLNNARSAKLESEAALGHNDTVPTAFVETIAADMLRNLKQRFLKLARDNSPEVAAALENEVQEIFEGAGAPDFKSAFAKNTH